MNAPRAAFVTTMTLVAVLVLVILFAYLAAPTHPGTGCAPGSTLVTTPIVECAPYAPAAS